MTPSVEQAEYYKWVQEEDGSVILESVAGSGKTTTLIYGTQFMKGRIFIGAYNKGIASEMKERIGPDRPNIFVSTMHAAGFGAWRRIARNVKVNGNKCEDLFKFHGGDKAKASVVCQLVSLAKQSAFGVGKSSADDLNAWIGLIEHFNIDCGEHNPMDMVIEAQMLLKQSISADTEVVDFDDMIYAPLIHNARVFEHDWVLVDEAQDTNASRRALALRLLRRGGRLVAVGDPHQAIYGFTGADADSLDLIGKAVNAKRMSLSVSYRCPRAVVRKAQEYVSHIQSAPSAPEGEVRDGSIDEAHVGDAVLCRFNKPLIKLAFELIAAGKPVKVEGREIGNGLKALVRKWKVRSLVELEARLNAYMEREVNKLRAKEKESAAVAIEDKVGCLLYLIERQNLAGGSLDDLVAEIDSLFADDGDYSKRIVLSSIHKSKGKEWHNVFWIQTGPSPWARKDWEIEQENNLMYVATTRAQSRLIMIPDGQTLAKEIPMLAPAVAP